MHNSDKNIAGEHFQSAF